MPWQEARIEEKKEMKLTDVFKDIRKKLMSGNNADRTGLCWTDTYFSCEDTTCQEVILISIL